MDFKMGGGDVAKGEAPPPPPGLTARTRISSFQIERQFLEMMGRATETGRHTIPPPPAPHFNSLLKIWTNQSNKR